MQVPFDYAQRRVFEFAAGKPVCCAQDDIAGSETRGTRSSTAPAGASISSAAIRAHGLRQQTAFSRVFVLTEMEHTGSNEQA
jgi:hypothetical protein